MSSKLTAHAPFLVLLLSTSTAQKKALLKTLDSGQESVLLEILHNLGEIEHNNPIFTAFIKKRKAFFRKFNRTLSITKRKKLLRSNKVQILRTLDVFKEALLELI